MNTKQHTSQRYNNELAAIRSQLMTMGRLVETQVTDAIKALIEKDNPLAQKVFSSDHEINALEMLLDDLCAEAIARRQPAAVDLRLLVAVIKVITDLERIGDEARKIGHYAADVSQGVMPSDSLNVDLRHLGEHVKIMLHGALDAFERLDVPQALQVALSDRRIDAEFNALERQLFSRMMEDANNIGYSLNVLRYARSLERIGDHAKNVCEYVIYLVEGRDVRHTNLEKIHDELTTVR